MNSCREFGYVFFFGELDVGITGIGRERKPFEPSFSLLSGFADDSCPRKLRSRQNIHVGTTCAVPKLYLPFVWVPRLAGITPMLGSRAGFDPLAAQLAFKGEISFRAIPLEARGADRDRNRADRDCNTFYRLAWILS